MTMPLMGLRYGVHPAFARDRFTVYPGQQFHYDAIHPACQLATLLLERSLPYFYTIFNAQEHVIGNRTACNAIGFPLPLFQLAEPPLRLAPAQQQRTRDQLLVLAGGVAYVTADMPCSGMAAALAYRSFIERWHWCGTPTRTSVNLKHVRAITLAFRWGVDSDIFLGLSLGLAVTLLHELTHAAFNARRPGMEGGCYISNSCLAETGKELEKRLFGGALGVSGFERSLSPDAVGNEFPIEVWIEDWPTLGGQLSYTTGAVANNIEQCEFHGPQLWPVYVFWEAPRDWVRSLFDPLTWMRVQATDAVIIEGDILRPERIMGHRHICEGPNNISRYNEDNDLAVPEGYELDPFEFVQVRRRVSDCVMLDDWLDGSETVEIIGSQSVLV